MSRIEPLGLLQAFSTLILDLHRLAQQDIEHFHRHALTRISQLLPFDSAWWGRAAVIEGLPQEHSSYLHHLPPGYLTHWQSIRHLDVTFGRVHAVPGQAVIIDMREPASGAGLNWLGEQHGISELLCVIHVDPHTCLSDHLTLYRKPGAPRFTEQDCLLLNHLMLHLVAAVSANQTRTLVVARVNRALPLLSPRENDVAQGFGEGKTYKEVARDLGLAPNTVRHHIRAIYSKLGVKDKAHIAHLMHAPPD